MRGYRRPHWLQRPSDGAAHRKRRQGCSLRACPQEFQDARKERHLEGRLLMATKLLPIRFIMATLLVTIGALVRDLILLRWQRTRDRIKVFGWYARNLPALVRERRELYRSQNTS